MIGRRGVFLGALAGLGACSMPDLRPRSVPAAVRPVRTYDAPMPAVPDPGYDAWVAAFRPRARAQGIPDATLAAAFARAGFLPGVIERDRNQTEFTRSLEDYLSIATSDERLALGRAIYPRTAPTLRQIEARYSVEPHVVAAIWGLESTFDTRRGTIPVISSLSTLAYEGRRATFMERQLIAALRILQNGDISPDRMTGSWAGAMGHTQFIPTSYLAYAVDFRGDGRRDIWAEDPTDALASTANYLARMGWTRGQPWGIEVRVPPGYAGPSGRGTARRTADWAALGLTGADGRRLPDYGPAALLLPAGRTGPAFLVYGNFGVIARYNNAESYVIGVGHLADRLAGGGPIRGSFPPDALGMTRADRQALQRKLTALGYDTQGADGVIGPDTRAAIARWQADRGLPATGAPSLDLLRQL